MTAPLSSPLGRDSGDGKGKGKGGKGKGKGKGGKGKGKGAKGGAKVVVEPHRHGGAPRCYSDGRGPQARRACRMSVGHGCTLAARPTGKGARLSEFGSDS